uniref:Uncharacterized protein n=1 Tax=Syphacia muris TaxID=451379 RepID=A0A0N5AGY8_9BILA
MKELYSESDGGDEVEEKKRKQGNQNCSENASCSKQIENDQNGAMNSENELCTNNLESHSYDYNEILEGDRPDPSVIMAKALMAGGIAGDEESSSRFLKHERTKQYYIKVVEPLIKDRFQAANWMREKHLLVQGMRCPACQLDMLWTKHNKCGDGYSWKCHNSACSRYKYTKSIRNGSLFQRSHISFGKWVNAMYLWSIDEDVNMAALKSDLSSKTMVDAFTCFRELCQWYFDTHPIKIGGNNHECILDMVPATRKRRLDSNFQQSMQYVVVITDLSSKPFNGCLELIDGGFPKDIYSFLCKVILKDTVVWCKKPESFERLYIEQQQLIGKLSTTSAKSKSDVGNTGVSSIVNVPTVLRFKKLDKNECCKEYLHYWHKLKERLKRINTYKEDSRKGYLYELMWKDRFSENTLETLCEHIAEKHGF